MASLGQGSSFPSPCPQSVLADPPSTPEDGQLWSMSLHPLPLYSPWGQIAESIFSLLMLENSPKFHLATTLQNRRSIGKPNIGASPHLEIHGPGLAGLSFCWSTWQTLDRLLAGGWRKSVACCVRSSDIS